MFETSQQEQSSQAPKIILGAIAVMLVLFGVLYFGHLSQEEAAAPGAAAEAPAAAAPAGAEAADPLRDLQILRSGLNRDRQTQTMAMWDVQIANRSRALGYREVQYTTNYYDSGGNVLSTRGGTFPEAFEPGDQKTFTQLNDGLYPVGTTRFSIEIKGAQAATP